MPPALRAHHFAALGLLALFLSFGVVSSVRAELIIDIDGYDYGYISADPGRDYGWMFSLSESRLITALGFWDNSSNGLLDSHAVGLWTTTGSLLASVSVDNSSTPVDSVDTGGGRWMFENLSSPFVLNPGTYILGADFAGGSDPVRLFVNAMFLDPIATYIEPRTSSATTAGLDHPDFYDGTLSAYFGPNMMMSAVPEPSSMLLVSMGLAAPGYRAWRRKFGRNRITDGENQTCRSPSRA